MDVLQLFRQEYEKILQELKVEDGVHPHTLGHIAKLLDWEEHYIVPELQELGCSDRDLQLLLQGHKKMKASLGDHEDSLGYPTLHLKSSVADHFEVLKEKSLKNLRRLMPTTDREDLGQTLLEASLSANPSGFHIA